MYIEITPTDYIVSFRQKTDGPTGYNVDYHYSDDPDYQSAIIDFTQLKQDLVVSIHLENGVWVADHTYDDMAQAIANGVLVRLTDETNDRYAIVGGYTDDSYIFVTNDTDYCYAYIVTDADAWSMQEVLEGEDGVGIASVTFNPDYTLTLTLTNGDTYTSQSLRGAQGPAGQDGEDGAQGPEGPEGPEGPQGVGIASTVLNADYTLTITLTNGNSYTTPSIRGAQGPAGQDGRDGVDGADGADGADGVGIASTVLNADYTLTITLTNGDSYTTSSIRGATGATGPAGPGVPTGGTAGQVLAKVDGTNYNTEWITPSAASVGTLDTTAATALATSASESFSGNISLHKVSKTGDYGDLLNKPTIPAAGIPAGGSAGQVLSKIDGTDYNTQWTTPKDIYWATYGTTTFAELTTAWNAGKQILCFWSNRVYNLIYVGTSFTFGYVWGTTTYRLACSAGSVWSNTSDSNQAQITVTGLLKGNGSGSVTAAVAGTDYQAPLVISLNGSSTTSPSFYAPTSAGTNGYVLKSNGSGAPTWGAPEAGLKELTIDFTPTVGTYTVGEISVVATAWGITEQQLYGLCNHQYDRICFDDGANARYGGYRVEWDSWGEGSYFLCDTGSLYSLHIWHEDDTNDDTIVKYTYVQRGGGGSLTPMTNAEIDAAVNSAWV